MHTRILIGCVAWLGGGGGAQAQEPGGGRGGGVTSYTSAVRAREGEWGGGDRGLGGEGEERERGVALVGRAGSAGGCSSEKRAESQVTVFVRARGRGASVCVRGVVREGRGGQRGVLERLWAREWCALGRKARQPCKLGSRRAMQGMEGRNAAAL